MPEPEILDGNYGAETAGNGNRFQVLGFEQVNRLHRVMETCVPIHGRGNFPTLDIKLKDLVHVVRTKLKSDGIVVRDVRLNGGAASYILGNETSEVYNDLDLIFGVSLTSEDDMKRIKDAVLGSLLNFLPAGVSKERMSPVSLSEAYVRKMVKIYDDANRWSLISLSNVRGRNVELKFAERMRRQFEFSVDSFQIILDSLLTFYEVSRPAMTEHFYPTVVAESVYGSFDIALDHLNRKLIATRNPEEIRGGGLLKYCNLLVRGFRPTSDADVSRLERYMCSRFFIDFPDIDAQRVKLERYLADHFSDDDLRYAYLAMLWHVINTSTVCLMGHERRQTLSLIANQARIVFDRKAYQKSASVLGMHFELSGLSAAACYPSMAVVPQLPTLFDQSGMDLVVDQVYYGPFCCPPVLFQGAAPAPPAAESYYPTAVYMYDCSSAAAALMSPALSPCESSASSTVSSCSDTCCCPYCDECPECAAAAATALVM